MYSIYLVHVLTFSTVLCDIQRFQDGTFIADFIVINKGRMLYPTIVMFIEDLTLNECTKYCIKHLDCVTFNYHLRTRACELVDQNFDEYEALDDDPNWYNYGTPEKIDGGWSNWFEGSTCSATCGYGFQTHYRTCTAPEPKYGGVPCIGNRVQTVSCKIVSCPIDGLSDWINDGQCSVTCGGGILNQIKTCTNPAPQHGGQQCTEQPKRTIACNEQKCPIDGGRSDWVNDGQCSVTCGGGTLKQMKTCTNPAPQHGGQQCTEQPRRTTACNEQKCPIDGGLSDWINEGKCSVTCGGGTLKQMKTCTNPAPQHGGQQCTEQPRRTVACTEQKCPPVNGGLSNWINEGKCSVTCGGGTINQIKTCTNPAPQHGGKECTEQPRRTAACNKQRCSTCIKHEHNGGCCRFPHTYNGKSYDKCWLNHDKEYVCIGVDNAYRRCLKQTVE